MLLLLGVSITAAVLIFRLFRPWLQAIMAGAPVSIIHIIGMRMRGNPPELIIPAYISLHHSGDMIPLSEVESTYIANPGRIHTVKELVDEVLAEQGA